MKRVLGDLTVDVFSPEDTRNLSLPYRAQVRCDHGESRMIWTRICATGCHQDPFKMFDCATVSPSEDQIRNSAIVQHAKRYGCPCCSVYWAQWGPMHEPHLHEERASCSHKYAGSFVNEGPVRGESREALLVSLSIERQFKQRWRFSRGQ
jgi:hypothetical protein